MARPAKVTATGNGSTPSFSAPYFTNWRDADPVTSIALSTNGSTTTCQLQLCFDDTQLVAEANLVWFAHATLTALTASTFGVISQPVTAFRMALGATGTDTWTMRVLQSGG